MALQEEINEAKKEIITDGYPMSIGELISLYKDGEIDIHPEFQRIFRWTIKQKSKLIESIMLGIPVPSIFVSQRPDGIWDVVDGLQRLSTIFEFVGILKDENGDLIPPSELVETSYLKSLANKQWDKVGDEANSLDTTQRLTFKREKIDIKIVKKESDVNIKYELFQRLNTLGTKLSDQEVRNCLLIMIDRDFYFWLKDLSDNQSFLNTISLADRLINEKYNMELALRFIILCRAEPESIRAIKDFNEYITDQMILITQDVEFNRAAWREKFISTFSLLESVTAENSFKKYVTETDRFGGKFLVGAFEAIAIGLGKNIDLWNGVDRGANFIEDFANKIKSVWRDADSNRYGAGVNVTTRAPYMIPLGVQNLRP